MKRANGSGCIKKQSGKRRKPYAVIVTVGNDENDRQVQKYIGYFEKRLDAEHFLADYQRDPSIARIVPTFADLYEELLRRLERKGRADKTLTSYKDVYPYYADYHKHPITNIKTAEINALIQHHIDLGHSYSLLHKIKGLASQIMKIAMEEDYITKNYASLVALPQKPKPDKTIFTDTEVDAFFELAKTDDWAKIICIMIYTMTRPGEVLTILKFQVHPTERYMIGGIKTEAGMDRILPLHKRILPFIEYFMNQKSEYLISRDGKRINYRYFFTKYYETLEAVNAQRLPPMRCRKTGATMLKRTGADDFYITRIIGHTDIEVTDVNYIADEVAPLVQIIDGMM